MNTIEVQVHLIATDKPFEWKIGQIVKRSNDKLDISTHNVFRADAPSLKQEGQHLYFTNSEEIKEGDWYLTHLEDGSFPVHSDLNPRKCQDSSYDFTNCKKIVASTNPELWENPHSSVAREYKAGEQIADKISTSFISSYIKRYNEGDKITEVFLETTEYIHEMCEESPFPALHIKQLKLTSNGEVIVVPAKEVKPKPVKERDNLNLLELVCQLHFRALQYPSKEMHDAYIEARTELESRISQSRPVSTPATESDAFEFM